jgi:hypothetical protein
MWQTKPKKSFVPFNELNTLLKYLCASPKNIVHLKDNTEIFMDENNNFFRKSPNKQNFECYNPSYNDLMRIVAELKETNVFSDFAIEVLYCEM